ncbi:protein kish-A-like [Hyaena hyaena]|uniref:protein kish-A-like n=1 Tax=Hyaena hyaena TaxID=95912 RepID=UPI001920FC1B|nr:protein kish-A-like [Hyaena hyaena]
MSAIFNFQSRLTVILLLVCSCVYIPSLVHSFLDRSKTGLLGIFWKHSRIGEQQSPYVAVCCIVMASSFLFATPWRAMTASGGPTSHNSPTLPVAWPEEASSALRTMLALGDREEASQTI